MDEYMNVRKRKAPDFLITHQFDNDICDPETNAILNIDDYNTVFVENKPVITSHIYRTNRLHANYISGQRELTEPESSRDKVSIGDSEDGLPFKIVARDFSDGNADLMFDFIDDHVVTLMRRYAKLLSLSDDPEKIIKNLIQELDTAQEEHANTSHFNMSIVIVYEYDDEVYCAGFVQGETGLAYRRSEKTLREIEEKHKEEDTLPLTANDYQLHQLAKSSSIDTTKRIFLRKVERNNKIYGYSYLLEGLRQYNFKKSDTYEVTDRLRICLDDNPLKEKTHALFKSLCINARINEETCEIGAPFTSSYIIIPSEEIQALKRNRIQPRLALEKHKEELLRNISEYGVDSDLYKAGKKVYDTVEKLESNPEYHADELVLDLIACNNALTNNSKENINALHARANLAQGRPSPENKDWAKCLQLLGAIIAVIGACLLPTPAGIGLIVAGGVIGTSGFGMFYHAHRHGRSKELADLAKECNRSVKRCV